MSVLQRHGTSAHRLAQASTAAVTIALFLAGYSARAQSLTEAPPQPALQKPAPSFQAATMQSSIAPSGYSDGATESQARQVASLVIQLQRASYLQQLTPNQRLACHQQVDLLHAVLTHPDDFQANQLLGLFYLQHSEPALAAQYLRIATYKRPAAIPAAHQLLIAYIESHNYPAAQALAAELLRQNPSDALAHRLNGSVEAAAGHSASALAEYQRSIALDPGADNAYSAGLSILALGSFVQAQSVFTAAVATHPDSAKLWLGLGLAHLLQSHQAQATDPLVRAATLDPNQALPLTLLATFPASAEAQHQILHLIQAFAVVHPDNAVAHYNYALVLWQQGHLLANTGIRAQVVAELQSALHKEPSFAAAHFQLGLAEESDANPAAIAQFQQALALEPDVAEWRYRLARAYRRAGQNAQAEAEMAKFKLLDAKRNAGADVSANLLQGLPPDLLGVEAPHCDTASVSPTP